MEDYREFIMVFFSRIGGAFLSDLNRFANLVTYNSNSCGSGTGFQVGVDSQD